MDDENVAKRRRIVIADDEEEMGDNESVTSNPDVEYDDGEIDEEIREDDGEDLMDNIYE